ncbi:MAG TPA: hypothetical protein VGB30_05030 [bacterium]|jgi:hypothetical protein
MSIVLPMEPGKKDNRDKPRSRKDRPALLKLLKINLWNVVPLLYGSQSKEESLAPVAVVKSRHNTGKKTGREKL